MPTTRQPTCFPAPGTRTSRPKSASPSCKAPESLYNRIAGPNGIIGLPRGVLIARVNTDISLADFELGVRNLISNVENAYWDLYFAYRDLHAKIVARDSALETWRRIHALYVTGRRGGEADKEAQARDQYYFFQAEVEDALTGRLFDGTRTNNGSSGGTFRGNPGVYVTERRLRLTMGLPPNDHRLDSVPRRSLCKRASPSTGIKSPTKRCRVEPSCGGNAPCREARRAGTDRRAEFPLAAAGRRRLVPLARSGPYAVELWPQLAPLRQCLHDPVRRPVPGMAARREFRHADRVPAGTRRRAQRRNCCWPASEPCCASRNCKSCTT